MMYRCPDYLFKYTKNYLLVITCFTPGKMVVMAPSWHSVVPYPYYSFLRVHYAGPYLHMVILVLLYPIPTILFSEFTMQAPTYIW